MPKHNTANSANSQPEYPKTFPFRQPSPEEILRLLGLSQYLDAPPLRLTVISDTAAQAQATIEQTLRAGNRFLELMPSATQPRAIAQHFIDVEEIHRSARIEKASAETTGLSLLVLLCKVEPADLVIGIGEQGASLVADLRREATKMYPDQVQKFVTQTELEQASRVRSFAGDPDAFLLIALERLYKTSATHSSDA